MSELPKPGVDWPKGIPKNLPRGPPHVKGLKDPAYMIFP